MDDPDLREAVNAAAAIITIQGEEIKRLKEELREATLDASFAREDADNRLEMLKYWRTRDNCLTRANEKLRLIPWRKRLFFLFKRPPRENS